MLIVDAFAFCRNGEQQEGKVALKSLPRLQSECVGHNADKSAYNAELHWSLVGFPGGDIISKVNKAASAAGAAYNSIGEDHGAASAYPRVQVSVTGQVQLQCQRCLTPYVFDINASSVVVFAKDEDAADNIDAVLSDSVSDEISDSEEYGHEHDSFHSEVDYDSGYDSGYDAQLGDDEEIEDAQIEYSESGFEVVVGSKSFNMMELIEDEALLALPLAPKHDVCPDGGHLDAFVSTKMESPFAALKTRFTHE